MFPLGHLGITLGIALVVMKVRPVLASRIDLRFVLFGAILPDIIDKLLGHVVLAGTLDNGRLVGHTAAFSLFFIAIGVILTSDRLAVVGFAGAVHLGLDLMWYYPSTLLWPVHGWEFPAEDFEVYDWITTLGTDGFVQAGELIGGTILLAFILRYGLLGKGRLRRFLADGELSQATSARNQK